MKARIFTLFIVSAFLSLQGMSSPVDQGKTIFTSRCGNCHKVDKVFVGPALGGVAERRKMDWIIKFVKSSQTMVKAGDKDAVSLFQKFNNMPMPDHPDLTDDNIKNIVAYISAESAIQKKAETLIITPQKSVFTMLTITSYKFFISYFAVVVLLIMALLFAVQVKEYERRKSGIV